MRRGLGYDWSDITVFTNIGDDHVGQDGIKSIEDIIFIKSLLAERVRERGTLILNAENRHIMQMTERPAVTRVQKNIVYFSRNSMDEQILAHVSSGGLAFVVEGGWIVEVGTLQSTRILKITDAPVTMNGTAEFQVSNLLAAVAACRVYGIAPEMIRERLSEFQSCMHNPGRANLYKLNGGYVMIDYGHNSDAFDAVCRMAKKWNGRRVTGVIGVPGDRHDHLISHAARIAARGFDRIVVKEDYDLRGRNPGAVARILYQTIRHEAPNVDCKIVLDECDALKAALREMNRDEVVVMFYDKLQPVAEVLEQFSAERALTIPDIQVNYEQLRKSARGTSIANRRYLGQADAYAS